MALFWHSSPTLGQTEFAVTLVCPYFTTVATPLTPALLTYGFGGASAPLTPALPTQTPRYEHWPAPAPLAYQTAAGWQGTFAGEFGVIAAEVTPGMDPESGFAQLYTQLFTQMLTWGYPHLLRIWNYFPALHEVQRGLDGYQRFCLGRAQALEAAPALIDRILPAATTIGTAGGLGQLIALIGRQPGRHFSNPRQIDPLAYPACYSPRSPNFARATQVGPLLLLSGTASIVGHASLHPGDTLAQTQEIIRNIEALLAQVPHARLCQLKVFLRSLADQPQVAELLAHAVGSVPTLFLEGAICRPELRLEIEGVACISAT